MQFFGTALYFFMYQKNKVHKTWRKRTAKGKGKSAVEEEAGRRNPGKKKCNLGAVSDWLKVQVKSWRRGHVEADGRIRRRKRSGSGGDN